MKADLEDGYTQIAHEIIEAACRVDLSGRQSRVFWIVIRKTYGWKQKMDIISASQIKEAINYEGDETNIRADVRTLIKRNLLVKNGRKIGPNPDVTTWVYDKKQIKNNPPKQIENDLETDRKQSAKQIENDPLKENQTDRKQSGGGLKTIRGQIENDPENRLKTIPTKDKRNLPKETYPKKRASAKSEPKPELDFSVLGMTDEQVSEVIRIRKKNSKTAKQAELSQRIVDGLAKEFYEASIKCQMTIDDLLTEWESRGWLGFKADWIKPSKNSQHQNQNAAEIQAWLDEENQGVA